MASSVAARMAEQSASVAITVDAEAITGAITAYIESKVSALES